MSSITEFFSHNFSLTASEIGIRGLRSSPCQSFRSTSKVDDDCRIPRGRQTANDPRVCGFALTAVYVRSAL